MRKATALLAILLLLGTYTALGQVETEFFLEMPLSEDYTAPYTIGEAGSGVHSGARTVYGPVDLDNDGLIEVLVSDYTGGGRVHVIENTGEDTWELAYSTPWVDSTATTENIRAIAGGDLDGDGNGEIFFQAGRGYSETNPNIDQLPIGLYVYEFNGTDFGELPVSVYEFDGDLPDRFRTEQIAVYDIDGDSREEIMFGNNGSDNRYDNWYILSVTGDFGSGFEAWVEEARLSSRASEDFDPVNRGGGSPYAIHPADLDGDGTPEIVLHSWNNFNLTTGEATDADTYNFPGDVFLNAADADQVSFFGGVAIDINDDGDDEVFFPNLQTGDLALLNYEAGEDVLVVTPDNVVMDLIPDISTLGIAAGDLDRDSRPGLFGSGPSYGAGSIDTTPIFVRVAEFLGGDVEDPANYASSFLEGFWEPYDTLRTNFDLIQRDSAGVMSQYYEETAYTGKDRAGGQPGQGPLFVSKMAFLGDPDGDGDNELAVAFQGVDDSTYVIQETFNPEDSTYTRQIVERQPVENRVFLRIVESGPSAVAVDDPNDVPTGFALSPNYPNPFNPSTSFSFTLPREARVSVRVYDATGRLVKTLINNHQYLQGTHQVLWDGTNAAGGRVASGTYFYSLEHRDGRQVRPMVLVK